MYLVLKEFIQSGAVHFVAVYKSSDDAVYHANLINQVWDVDCRVRHIFPFELGYYLQNCANTKK